MFHSFLHRRLFFDGACFKQNPRPSNVLGVFGLSVHTTERELDDEFSRFGRVEKVTIVYDQRVGRQLSCCLLPRSDRYLQSDRSRGFGFIKLGSVEDATRCVQELNGIVCSSKKARLN